MTYEDVVIAALARTLDWDGEFPSSRRPMYRRIGQHQQQLFSVASKANPDYYGVCAVGGFDASGCLDLRDLVDLALVDQAAGVQHVEISDEGTSLTLSSGDRVDIVSVADPEAGLVPRVTLRQFVFRGVGTDLTGVVSIRVWFSRIPDLPAIAEDGTTKLELLEQHQELLVIDLTKDLVRKTMNMEPEVKTAIMNVLSAEEKEALGDYSQDILSFAIGQAHRFSEPAPTATR